MDRTDKLRYVYQELDGFEQFESQRFHAAEGFRHYLVKHSIAYLINQQGYQVGLEVETPDGDIDVLSLGASDAPAVAIEVQTDCSPQERREKAEQYTSDLIGEVIVIDPTDAPDNLSDLEAWLKEEVPGL